MRKIRYSGQNFHAVNLAGTDTTTDIAAGTSVTVPLPAWPALTITTSQPIIAAFGDDLISTGINVNLKENSQNFIVMPGWSSTFTKFNRPRWATHIAFRALATGTQVRIAKAATHSYWGANEALNLNGTTQYASVPLRLKLGVSGETGWTVWARVRWDALSATNQVAFAVCDQLAPINDCIQFRKNTANVLQYQTFKAGVAQTLGSLTFDFDTDGGINTWGYVMLTANHGATNTTIVGRSLFNALDRTVSASPLNGVVPDNMDNLMIGALPDTVVSAFMDGAVDFIGVGNFVSSATEWNYLISGADPRKIRPRGNILEFYHFDAVTGNLSSLTGQVPTLTGAPTHVAGNNQLWDCATPASVFKFNYSTTPTLITAPPSDGCYLFLAENPHSCRFRFSYVNTVVADSTDQLVTAPGLVIGSEVYCSIKADSGSGVGYLMALTKQTGM